MKKIQLNIVFFGTPEFSNIVLQKLIDSGYKPSLVITAPDKPVGRKQKIVASPVKNLAAKYDIPILQPKKLNSEFAKKLQTTRLDEPARSPRLRIVEAGRARRATYNLFIVAAYGKIIPANILKIPKYGAVNVHPSLLPLYRGPSPIQAAILSEDEKIGVTIIKMDEKMDHGPILAYRESPISNQNTYESLGNKLFKIGAELLIDILPKYVGGKIKPKKQNHKKATYTKIIKKEDGHINWSHDAAYIERQLRAFTPWPGIYTFYNNKRLKILTLTPTSPIVTPGITILGKVTKYENGIAVQTGNGLIVPQKIQLESKKLQTAQEFLRGYPEIIGSRLK